MDKYADKYIGKILDERYEILELIGSGGMANVYKALCHRLNRYDAIKIMRDDTAMNEDFRRRFRAESLAVAKLSHPNIVSVYDVSHSDGIEYIVMELIDGITLKQYLDKVGALYYSEALDFSTQIAKALCHAHEKGIIHRDIKPQNIMLLKDGRIKVADFGIASLENGIEVPSDEAVGSVHYIAPEQARGFAPDARSDIYSLGIVMYEMLTGQLPYTGNSAVEIAVMHMNTDAVPPRDINPDIPEELERICLKAMSSDIEERYQCVDELLYDLEAFRSAEIAAQAQVDTALIEDDSYDQEEEEYQNRKRKRSNKIAFATGLLAVLIFIIIVFIFINAYFLKDTFGTPDKFEVGGFVGRYCDDIVNDTDLTSIYKFNVTFKVDPDTEYGKIIDQEPDEGALRSYPANNEKVDIELIVSSGDTLENQNNQIVVPEVVNKQSAEALRALEKEGLKCTEIEEAPSESITKDFVISTEPAGGETVEKGSAIKVVISSGPEAEMKTVPQLKGLSKDAAIAKITENGFTVGDIASADSSLEAGTVIWQSVDAATEAEANSPIGIKVSNGEGD